MKSSKAKHHFKALLVLTVIFSLSVCSIPALGQQQEQIQTIKKMGDTFARIAEKASPAVVGIVAEKAVAQQPTNPFEEDFFDYFFRRSPRQRQQQPQRRQRQLSQGSGFIISKDGYILTNNHVVKDADQITVMLLDGREFKEANGEAKVVGTDPSSEVAVIKIEATDLPVIEMGNSDDAKVGEWVLAIGNPFGLSHTVTAGIISAKGRSIGLAEYEDFIQTDAAINPGNSGGPMINIDGKAIGINTAIISRTGGSMGIGMAIPIGMAQSVFEQIVKTGTVTRGFLGVELQELNPELAERFGLEEAMGALVTNVVPDTAADKAGLQQGDIILEVNGEDIEDREDLRNQIGLMKPGTEIEITIWRDMEKRDYTVELGTRDGIGQLSQKTSDIMKELGMSVTELNSEIAQKYGYEDTQGVVISSVEYNSPAAQAGLQPGVKIAEVDRQQVNTLKDFDSMMQQAIDEGGALLLVQQGQYSRYVYLQIPKN